MAVHGTIVTAVKSEQRLLQKESTVQEKPVKLERMQLQNESTVQEKPNKPLDGQCGRQKQAAVTFIVVLNMLSPKQYSVISHSDKPIGYDQLEGLAAVRAAAAFSSVRKLPMDA